MLSSLRVELALVLGPLRVELTLEFLPLQMELTLDRTLKILTELVFERDGVVMQGHVILEDTVR